ncbi:hypothetical protein [uncultured Roseibium sp.]|uniref:hypothetical protein n=1 Tax=uncultured Roseibium sp. TaxID=1936171 RepID=UPI0032168B06
MLNAVLSSKSGRLHPDDDQGVRWRDLFRGSEDLLTATVFERLSYLRAERVWSLLAYASAGQLPSYKIAVIHDIEFWPMWSSSDRRRGVEPDVFISLDLGDPAKRVHIIIEAKYGGKQTYTQWRDELLAWKENYIDDEIKAPELIILLAIGGSTEINNKIKLKEYICEFAKNEFEISSDFIIAQIEWRDIARSCSFSQAENLHEQRLLSDLKKGLELHGYYHRELPSQMEKIATDLDFENSLDLLRKSNENIARSLII